MRLLLYLFALVLLVLIGLEIWNIIKSLIARNWKTVTGEIVNWDMHYSNSAESSNLIVNKLQYAYRVSGIERVSHRVAFGFPWIMDAASIGTQFEKLLVNAPELKIYYNPKKPQQSTLMVGLKSFHLYKLFFYGLLLCVVILATNEL